MLTQIVLRHICIENAICNILQVDNRKVGKGNYETVLHDTKKSIQNVFSGKSESCISDIGKRTPRHLLSRLQKLH